MIISIIRLLLLLFDYYSEHSSYSNTCFPHNFSIFYSQYSAATRCTFIYKEARSYSYWSITFSLAQIRICLTVEFTLNHYHLNISRRVVTSITQSRRHEQLSSQKEKKCFSNSHLIGENWWYLFKANSIGTSQSHMHTLFSYKEVQQFSFCKVVLQTCCLTTHLTI